MCASILGLFLVSSNNFLICSIKNHSSAGTIIVISRLLSNGRPVAWGALVESVGDQSFVQGARTGA